MQLFSTREFGIIQDNNITFLTIYNIFSLDWAGMHLISSTGYWAGALG